MAEQGRPLEEIAAACKKAAGEMGRLLACLNVGLSLQSDHINGEVRYVRKITMNNYIEPFVKLLI